jgi:predicted DNA-binding transcriptional regulator AlpA
MTRQSIRKPGGAAKVTPDAPHQVASPDKSLLNDPLMFLPEVEVAVGMTSTTIWRHEKQRKFPPRIKVGGRNAWFRSQIEAYLESLRDGGGIGPAPTAANEARRLNAQRRRASRDARAAA